MLLLEGRWNGCEINKKNLPGSDPLRILRGLYRSVGAPSAYSAGEQCLLQCQLPQLLRTRFLPCQIAALVVAQPASSTQRFVALVVRVNDQRLQRFARDRLQGLRMPVVHRLPLSEWARAHELKEPGGGGAISSLAALPLLTSHARSCHEQCFPRPDRPDRLSRR